MKNWNSSKSFLQKNWLCLLLAAASLMLACCAVSLKLKMNGTERIVGTYNTVQEPGPQNGNGTYLVFQQDQSYCVYRQGEGPLEEGVYQKTEEIVTLDHDGELRDLVYDKTTGRVYDLHDGTSTIYNRMSDTPLFINMEAGSKAANQ